MDLIKAFSKVIKPEVLGDILALRLMGVQF